MPHTLTTLRAWCQRSGLVLGLLAVMAGGNAHAGNVGISVGIHAPGIPVYVNPPPPPPPPRYVRPLPPAVVYYPAAPAHGYWAPPPYGHKQAYKQYRKDYKRYQKHYRKHYYRDYDD